MSDQTITLEDILFAARTVYVEARDQTYDGMKAVVHVLVNRRDKRVGDADHSLAATALRWRQFSGWNEDDPNRAKGLKANVDDPVYRKCVRATLEALDEPDFTKGARHYMTKARYAKGWPSSWGPMRRPCYAVDDHLFFNDVA